MRGRTQVDLGDIALQDAAVDDQFDTPPEFFLNLTGVVQIIALLVIAVLTALGILGVEWRAVSGG